MEVRRLGPNVRCQALIQAFCGAATIANPRQTTAYISRLDVRRAHSRARKTHELGESGPFGPGYGSLP